MITKLLERRIAAAERAYGVRLDEVRYLTRVSKRILWRYMRFVRLNKARGPLPEDARSVAAICGSLADDCGTCVQIGARIGLQQGVPREIVEAAARRRPERLPPELREVYDFAGTVTSGQGDVEPLRERLRLRYGDAGLAELCLVIAMHRVFPTFKRGLGYHASCSLTPLEV